MTNIIFLVHALECCILNEERLECVYFIFLVGQDLFRVKPNKSFLLDGKRRKCFLLSELLVSKNVYDIVHVYKWFHQSQSNAIRGGERGNSITVAPSFNKNYCCRNGRES